MLFFNYPHDLFTIIVKLLKTSHRKAKIYSTVQNKYTASFPLIHAEPDRHQSTRTKKKKNGKK